MIKSFKFLLILAFTALFFTFSEPVSAQETEQIIQIEEFSLQKFLLQQQEYISEVQRDLSQIQRDYLVIAIAILSLGGIGFYFLNLRPIHEKMGELDQKTQEFPKELQKAIEKLNSEMEVLTGKSEESMRNFANENIKQSEKKLKDLYYIQKNEFSGETARNLALNSESLQDLTIASYYWVRAAYFFHLISISSIVRSNLQRAEKNLNLTKKEDSKQSLPEEDLSSFLTELAKDYKEETENLRKLFNDKHGLHL